MYQTGAAPFRSDTAQEAGQAGAMQAGFTGLTGSPFMVLQQPLAPPPALPNQLALSPSGGANLASGSPALEAHMFAGSGAGSAGFYAYVSQGDLSSSQTSLTGSQSLPLPPFLDCASGTLGGSAGSLSLSAQVVQQAHALLAAQAHEQSHVQPQHQAQSAAAHQQQLQPQSQVQAVSQGNAAARGCSKEKEKKGRARRPYKRPEQVQAERKEKSQVKEKIWRLEQQLGAMKRELQGLQQEKQALQRKQLVLNKQESFRRCAAVMEKTLTQTMTMGQPLAAADWGQHCSRRALDAAEKGLPAPEVLEQLRGMSVEEAVASYNSTVAKVRDLLQQMDRGPDRKAAQQQLEDIFTLKDGGSTFGYLQVVNPVVYAQLMQEKLDPASSVRRSDPVHWRGVLMEMSLSEDQEAQLILLVQSHMQQVEQLVQRKSQVIKQLTDELTTDLLSMELQSCSSSGEQMLSEEGSSSSIPALSVEDSAAAAAAGAARDMAAAAAAALAVSGALHGTAAEGEDDDDGGDVDGGDSLAPLQSAGSLGHVQAEEELKRLIQLEYWLKFDFMGCVRKLLPAEQQARCLVASYPFYPDPHHLGAAIKEKAGQLWQQLQQSTA